ncbi:MAG: hypothetical protein ABGZ23_12325 [Fuerstiella sp.]
MNKRERTGGSHNPIAPWDWRKLSKEEPSITLAAFLKEFIADGVTHKSRPFVRMAFFA